jgi:hypothetical protein
LFRNRRNSTGTRAGTGRQHNRPPGLRLAGTIKQATTQLATWTLIGQPIAGSDLAAALRISSSYARRLIREHDYRVAAPAVATPGLRNRCAPLTT